MNRTQLAHVLRAAADVAGDGRILVLGSQAILATHAAADLPPTVTLSVEADIAFFVDVENILSDAVDGAIGEDSMFHQTHGYYGQGVSIATAVLPEGWQERLVAFETDDSRPAQAVCLDPGDLVVAKLVAGRQKDLSYSAALLAGGQVDASVLRERARMLPVVGAVKRRVIGYIDRMTAGSQ